MRKVLCWYSLASLLSDKEAIVYIEKWRNISDINENLVAMKRMNVNYYKINQFGNIIL